MVEPVDPFQGRELHGLEAAPGAAPADDLGLVEADDRLGQGIIVGVADTVVGRQPRSFKRTLFSGLVPGYIAQLRCAPSAYLFCDA